MADSFTSNLNLRLPEVGAADSTWGGAAGINGDMQLLDAVFLATGLGTPVGLHVGATQVLNVEGTALFADSTDTTKGAILDSSLISTGTVRTFSFPDTSGVLAVGTGVPTGTVMSGYYGTTAPPGFVLACGRTIGDATSGATERANADCQALFTVLWGVVHNAQCPVTPGGRGASAAADWAAHKKLQLPDHRGRVMAALDNLGGTAAGVMPGDTVRAGFDGALLSSTMNGPNSDIPVQAGAGVLAADQNHIHANVFVVQPTILVDAIIAL